MLEGESISDGIGNLCRLKTGLFDNEERFAEFDGGTVFDQDFFDRTGFFGFNFVHQFHRFDDAQGVACFNLLSDFDKCGGIRAGCAVERTDHR